MLYREPAIPGSQRSVSQVKPIWRVNVNMHIYWVMNRGKYGLRNLDVAIVCNNVNTKPSIILINAIDTYDLVFVSFMDAIRRLQANDL
ncbi:hypothetical protein DSCO28_36060 [Desulfosarcina ovata subsp. sediminis]|uniref:Uncharacterized protein n=1 Tax=Desulfosarcina ovata subsp. sediminis TaxID=885957 RepID=A0A5K7ZS54_9BACT|nr:hypothetical protein DSCO28_36060 [Desulfosarcina ovata subsp. sediminis]